MSELPSTQAAVVSTIFLNLDGTPLSVFTQAEEIYGRPRIAKLLKKGGATISKDPKDADIILVNDGTDTGKQFMRVWSNDGHKVVLRYQWVHSCVSARRILREADNWGGCMAVDDGKPIEDNFSETEQKSLLPTPRQSPVDVPAQAPQSRVRAQSASSKSSRVVASGGRAPPSISQGSSQVPPALDDVEGTSSIGHLPPPNLIMALGDVLRNHPSPELQAQGAKIQSLPPRGLSEGRTSLMEEVEITGPFETATVPRISEKVRGKRRDLSSASRKNSLSQPPASSSSFAASPVPSGTIFTSSVSGSSLKFFVQVGYPKRIELVNMIKKNGGKIEAGLGGADYAILFTSKISKDYQHLLKSAIASNVPAISGQFIQDCIDLGELLDYAEYVFATPAKRGRAKPEVKRSPSLSFSDSEEEIPLAKKLKTAKPVKAEKAAKAGPSLKAAKTAETKTNTVPYTAPRVMNKYTEEELKFALLETFDLFSSNENATENDLASRLHQKMSQHTLASWRTMMGQRYRDEFQNERKRGSIQYRKRQAQLETEMARPSNASTRHPSPKQQYVGTDAEDIELFANFLAFGGGDDFGTDIDGPYVALAKKAPRRTADEWRQFWTLKSEDILLLYRPMATARDEQMQLEEEGRASAGR